MHNYDSKNSVMSLFLKILLLPINWAIHNELIQLATWSFSFLNKAFFIKFIYIHCNFFKEIFCLGDSLTINSKNSNLSLTSNKIYSSCFLLYLFLFILISIFSLYILKFSNKISIRFKLSTKLSIAIILVCFLSMPDYILFGYLLNTALIIFNDYVTATLFCKFFKHVIKLSSFLLFIS